MKFTSGGHDAGPLADEDGDAGLQEGHREVYHRLPGAALQSEKYFLKQYLLRLKI